MPEWTVWDELVKWETDIRGQVKGFQCDKCKTALCCRQLVRAAPWEGAEIANFLRKRGRIDPFLRSEFGEAQLASDLQSWWGKQRPCVFLRGHRCSIYEVRPVACREILAVKCFGGSTMKAVDTMELHRALEEGRQILWEDWGWKPLPLAVLNSLNGG
jgi:Fe-S-cluster containining protein